MRLILISGLISVILMQAWIRTAWTIDYQWRRSIYEKKCENKARPQLHCDGKCYLLKQIKKSESPDGNDAYPPLPEAFRQVKEITLFLETLWGWRIGALSMTKHLVNRPYRFPLLKSETFGIFHPPES